MADGTPVGTFVIDDDTDQRVACMGDVSGSLIVSTQFMYSWTFMAE